MSKKKDFTLIIDIFSWNFDVSANFDQLSRKKISKKLGFTPVLGKNSNYRVKINIIESRGSPGPCKDATNIETILLQNPRSLPEAPVHLEQPEEQEGEEEKKASEQELPGVEKDVPKF